MFELLIKCVSLHEWTRKLEYNMVNIYLVWGQIVDRADQVSLAPNRNCYIVDGVPEHGQVCNIYRPLY